MRCSTCESLNLDESRTCFNCGAELPVSDARFTPPESDVGTPARGFRPIWILWGCGGMLVMFLLLLGSCFVVAKIAMGAGEKEYAPAIESYLANARSGDYHRAYSEFGKEMHEAITEENYVSLDARMHEKMGTLQSKSLQFIQAGTDMKGTWGRIVYQCEFSKAKGTMTIGLRKEGKEWKINKVNYDSPVFLDNFLAKPNS